MSPEDLARLRRARDLMDREHARPLDVPVEFEQFMGAVRQIDDFFINLVRLPVK